MIKNRNENSISGDNYNICRNSQGSPGQSRPAVNDRCSSYLTRYICAVLRPFFVVPYTVSKCRKRPENRVCDSLRSFTTR